MGCHALVQGIFPSQGSNPGLLHCRQILYSLNHQGSTLAIIFQKPNSLIIYLYLWRCFLGCNMGNFLNFQLLKHWLCNMQLGIVMENWAHSVDQCQLQTQQFSVHLIDSLSILLRCNSFSEIQKVEVVQTSSRPPNSDHDFFWCKFGLGKCYGAASQSSHWGSLPAVI